ncbi:MAG: DUF898 family protein [Ramlibacter sp.]
MPSAWWSCTGASAASRGAGNRRCPTSSASGSPRPGCSRPACWAWALAAGAFAALLAGGLRTGRTPMTMSLLVLLPLAVILLMVAASAPARAYRQARVFRLVWNNIGVSHIARFKSRLRVRKYVFLRVRNLLLTVLTLGFYRPFALVSEYRMRVESVTLHVKGSLDQLAGQLAREEQALGDAIAGAVGLDLVG